MTIDDFSIIAGRILSRYHWKIDGSLPIEDSVWNKQIKNNKLTFTNTINETDVDSPAMISYLVRILNRLNNQAENIDVDFKFKRNKKDKINYIIIKATDNKMSSGVNISL